MIAKIVHSECEPDKYCIITSGFNQPLQYHFERYEGGSQMFFTLEEAQQVATRLDGLEHHSVGGAIYG